jgi:hypothetical protein
MKRGVRGSARLSLVVFRVKLVRVVAYFVRSE